MFDTLADRFDGIFHKLRSRGKLTDKEIDEVCRELRVALLEADVNVLVARNFIRRVKERAQGADDRNARSAGLLTRRREPVQT